MAIFLRGMTASETAVLTDAMMRSGEVLDTSHIPFYKADKHSTGGIGDKVSLILAPLVACCGVAVPMISGRGLGITGGTLDKLESIEGYRTDLAAAEFLQIVNDIQCSIVGQTADLAPADRKLYALRDVTGTVPSVPLISASIMCKKLAEGLDGLVLDVKWGRGAFMKTPEDAEALARSMIEIGRHMDKDITAVLTAMDQPLGRTAGNAVEVVESIDTLRGEGPSDLVDVTLTLGAQMLLLSGQAADAQDARQRLQTELDSGAALERFRTMIERHGGNPRIVDAPHRLPQAKLHHAVEARTSGTVSAVDADRIGRACLALGAGRRAVDDAVDHAVGIRALVKVGEAVEKGDPLFLLLANGQAQLDEARALTKDAVTIADTAVASPPLIGRILGQGRTT